MTPPIKGYKHYNPIHLTTIRSIVTSAIDETINAANNNEMNNITEANNELMSSTMDLNITESNLNTMLNNSDNLNIVTEMFNTSFEKVTTETEYMNTPMGHYEEDADYNYILFIVLGIVLGLLIIAGAILSVIYNHYKKSGFHEIPGTNKENCEVDPQTLVQIEQQIQQACSEDALINKR